MELNQIVFDIVRRIPAGRVMTYGQIARIVDTGPRVVGNILHKNDDPLNIPCHRVVNSKGQIALSYAFGGSNVQREKLEQEGIEFEKNKIDLAVYQFI